MVKQEPYSPTIAIRLLNAGIKKELEAMARKRKSPRARYEAYRRRILHQKPLPRASSPKKGLSAVVLDLKRAGATDRAVNRALANWVPPKRKVRAPKKRKVIEPRPDTPRCMTFSIRCRNSPLPLNTFALDQEVHSIVL